MRDLALFGWEVVVGLALLTADGVSLLNLAAILDLSAHPVSSLANLRDSVLFKYSEAQSSCSSGVNNWNITSYQNYREVCRVRWDDPCDPNEK